MAIKRQQKYPNTDTYEFENTNPKGRLKTGDCVYRALSGALGKGWCEVVHELADLACKTSCSPAGRDNYAVYLDRNGWEKYPQPRHEDKTKFTLKEFCKAHKTGTYIVHLPHHLTYVKNGKCHDTWDCSKFDSRVGNYWGKK